eukprot:GHVR01053319.1.p1 GENE.GHVR01053319.1~~GHVR01053319.1.p1  ORF type:complete len:180 (-),score=7.01 GHVR01053319.1:117-656(-)
MGAPLFGNLVTLPDPWVHRWDRVMEKPTTLYTIPGGKSGRMYVEALAEEVDALVTERLQVFLAVILNRNNDIKTMADIKRTLERRIGTWRQNEFDLLVDELSESKKQRARNTHWRQPTTTVHDVNASRAGTSFSLKTPQVDLCSYQRMSSTNYETSTPKANSHTAPPYKNLKRFLHCIQ